MKRSPIKSSALGAWLAAFTALAGLSHLLWLSTPASAAPGVHFERVELRVETRAASHSFRVELARTGSQRRHGLMYRTALGADEGMLLLFPEDRHAQMWMKNTLVPLDMLFIAEDGRIRQVVADTRPLSETVIGSEHPVRAVLELAAGTAARLGIRPGDRIRSPLFGEH